MRHGLILPGNAVNRSAPLNRGLVSWWTVLPNRIGGGGVTLRDLCRRFNGTLTNGPTWSGHSHIGGAGSIAFDGSNDRIECGAPSLNQSSITLCGWGKLDAAGSFPMLVSCSTSPSFTLEIRGNSGSGKIEAIVTGGSNPGTYGSSDVGTGWHHWTLTASTAGSAFYRDGVVVVSNSTSVSSATITALAIGSRPVGSNFWQGNINDVRAFSRALSALEVAALYQASRLGYPNELNWIQRPAFATEQGGGGGFNPVYARWSNIVIQPLTAA